MGKCILIIIDIIVFFKTHHHLSSLQVTLIELELQTFNNSYILYTLL